MGQALFSATNINCDTHQRKSTTRREHVTNNFIPILVKLYLFYTFE